MDEDFYERQANAMRNAPGLSLADGQFIDHWVEVARSDDRHHVMRFVASRRERNRVKAAEVTDRVNALQDEFVRVRKQAERNDVPWAELAKAQRSLSRERMALEKVLESLETSEATCAQMEEDPSAHLASFYNRYPTLNDRRPNLSIDLAADQRKRGVKAIS